MLTRIPTTTTLRLGRAAAAHSTVVHQAQPSREHHEAELKAHRPSGDRNEDHELECSEIKQVADSSGSERAEAEEEKGDLVITEHFLQNALRVG